MGVDPAVTVGSTPAEQFDVVIVGGGPAGLSAALILGRCCRKVLLCDRGTSRNWASRAMHGFISRDGIAPSEFAAIVHTELTRYATVSVEPVEVRKASPRPDGFDVVAGSRTVNTRKLLIATGLVDELPPIEGFKALFGVSVFQCPYCDGWEFRNRPLAAYGKRNRGLEMARALITWSDDVLLCTDGPAGLTAGRKQELAANGIRLIEKPVLRLEQEAGKPLQIVFRDGSREAREALFFDTPAHGQSHLAEQLGCTFDRHGAVLCDKHEATAVPGVYVAGNITRHFQLSIVAAAEGANAAFGINLALAREDFTRRANGASGGP